MQAKQPAAGWISRRLITGAAIVALFATFIVPRAASAATAAITLEPANQSVSLSNRATIKATLLYNGGPVQSGAIVTFKVTGANNRTGSAVTNNSGVATFQYTGSATGTDQVVATATYVSTPATSDPVEVTWTAAASSLALTPETMKAAVNTTQTVTATVADESGNGIPNVSVSFSVAGATAGIAPQAITTDANGKAAFSYTGANTGTDTVTAQTSAVGGRQATATIEWAEPGPVAKLSLAPETQVGVVGQPVSLTATATDAADVPVPNTDVTLTVTGDNETSTSATTNDQGQATLSYTGDTAGTDTAAASVDNVSSPESTIRWIAGPLKLAFAQSSATATVGSEVDATATLTDGNSDPVADVDVYYNVSPTNSAHEVVTTGDDGSAPFSYTGDTAGQDTVAAFADLNGNGTADEGEPAATMTVDWSAPGGNATLALDPGTQNVQTGSSATVTATLTNPAGSVADVDILFTVTGVNVTDGSQTTGDDGKAAFSYTGQNAGADTIKAFADLDGNGQQNDTEPVATATVNWLAEQPFAPAQPARPQPGCVYYAITQHNLCGGFNAYWNQFGGLAVYGYPLTEEFQENGVTVQYFERARFEWHPDAWPERYDVLLGLLGNDVTAGRSDEAPFKKTTANPSPSCLFFPATGHNLCAGFHAYWDTFGGLAVYGMPISEEFVEKNPDTGQEYTVQYFERARFEWHPSEWPERYDVMLGRLGAQILASHYGVH